MPWAYKDSPTLMIVDVAFTGEVAAHDLRECTSTLISLEKDKGRNKFLIDTTEMVFAASFTDLYDLPTKQYQEEGADRQARMAVILSTSPKEQEAAEFYELVCQSSGWLVQTFPERQPAVNWLTSRASSYKPDAGNGL